MHQLSWLSLMLGLVLDAVSPFLALNCPDECQDVTEEYLGRVRMNPGKFKRKNKKGSKWWCRWWWWGVKCSRCGQHPLGTWDFLDVAKLKEKFKNMLNWASLQASCLLSSHHWEFYLWSCTCTLFLSPWNSKSAPTPGFVLPRTQILGRKGWKTTRYKACSIAYSVEKRKNYKREGDSERGSLDRKMQARKGWKGCSELPCERMKSRGLGKAPLWFTNNSLLSSLRVV